MRTRLRYSRAASNFYTVKRLQVTVVPELGTEVHFAMDVVDVARFEAILEKVALPRCRYCGAAEEGENDAMDDS